METPHTMAHWQHIFAINDAATTMRERLYAIEVCEISEKFMKSN